MKNLKRIVFIALVATLTNAENSTANSCGHGFNLSSTFFFSNKIKETFNLEPVIYLFFYEIRKELMMVHINQMILPALVEGIGQKNIPRWCHLALFLDFHFVKIRNIFDHFQDIKQENVRLV